MTNRGVVIFLIFLIVMLPICFSASITYDANGNTIYTASDNLYRVYNSENKLWKIYNGTNESGILLEDYTYDLVDERVLMKKIYNSTGGWKETDIYVTPEYIRIKNASGTYDQMIVTHEGANIAQVNADNSTYFMLTDHLGSSSIVVGNANPVPQNNLVSYYPFDLNANDNVSQNNGVVSGAVLVTGKLNNAYSFNGTNTRINLTRPFISFNSSSACAWLNISNPAKVGSSAYSQTALNLYKDSNNSLRFGNDEAGSGGAIFIGYRYNGVEYGRETAQQVISANTFTFVCYTFNGTNLNLYVNAVDSDIVANSNSAGIASIVGGRSQTVGNWNGTIDELYLWNRSLSQDEVTQIYNKYSIDGVNQIIESNSYTPFGSIILGGTSTRFDYTGQEFESSLNQYDYHARMYRADWGKFLTPDSTLLFLYDPQQINRYSYACNNPYKYVDPDGKSIILVGENHGGGFIVGGEEANGKAIIVDPAYMLLGAMHGDLEAMFPTMDYTRYSVQETTPYAGVGVEVIDYPFSNDFADVAGTSQSMTIAGGEGPGAGVTFSPAPSSFSGIKQTNIGTGLNAKVVAPLPMAITKSVSQTVLSPSKSNPITSFNVRTATTRVTQKVTTIATQAKNKIVQLAKSILNFFAPKTSTSKSSSKK